MAVAVAAYLPAWAEVVAEKLKIDPASIKAANETNLMLSSMFFHRPQDKQVCSKAVSDMFQV